MATDAMPSLKDTITPNKIKNLSIPDLQRLIERLEANSADDPIENRAELLEAIIALSMDELARKAVLHHPFPDFLIDTIRKWQSDANRSIIPDPPNPGL